MREGRRAGQGSPEPRAAPDRKRVTVALCFRYQSIRRTITSRQLDEEEGAVGGMAEPAPSFEAATAIAPTSSGSSSNSGSSSRSNSGGSVPAPAPVAGPASVAVPTPAPGPSPCNGIMLQNGAPLGPWVVQGGPAMGSAGTSGMAQSAHAAVDRESINYTPGVKFICRADFFTLLHMNQVRSLRIFSCVDSGAIISSRKDIEQPVFIFRRLCHSIIEMVL